MSNPFEEENDDTTIQTDFNIEIWIETFGRKKVTWISGWNLDIKYLTTHIKNIKKKNGCNGTIKQIDDGTGKINNLIQLQGDHIDFIQEYLTSNGIDSSSIVIKG